MDTIVTNRLLGTGETMGFVDNLKGKAKVMKTKLTAVFYAFQDGRVGLLPKIIIGFTLLYALSPIDLIPDFIPVIGYLDDLLIVPALIALSVKLIPAEIMQECQKKAEENPLRLKKNWAFGVVFILIWVLVLFLLGKTIWQFVAR